MQTKNWILRDENKMTEVIKILNNIITNVLTALYRPCGFSLLLSFFSMFFYCKRSIGGTLVDLPIFLDN